MSVHAQLFGGLTSCSAMCATHPTATISVPNILSQRRVHSVCGLVVALEIKVTWRRRSQKGISTSQRIRTETLWHSKIAAVSVL